jgi:oligosaccharide repeat unit polymerase
MEAVPDSRRNWWPAVLFGGAVLALVAGYSVTISETPWALALLWILGAICLLQAAGIILKDGDLFAPPTLFIFFTAVLYVLRPLGIISGFPAVIPNYSAGDLCMALGLVIIATLGFYGGYWLPGSNAVARALPVGAPEWPRLRLYAMVGVTFLVGCGAWLFFMSKVGGLAYWLMNLHYGVHHLRRGLGHMYILASFSGLAFILLYAYAVKRGVHRLILYPFSTICLAILLTLGERGLFILWMLMAITIYHYLGRRLDWKRAVLYVLPVVILFTAVGMWREFTAREELPSFEFQIQALQMNLTSFDMLLYIARNTPDPVDYQWGRFIPGFLTTPIPRAIFPDKQETVAVFVNDRAMGESYSGTIAISLPGEGYVNAGLAGTILWPLVLGFLSRIAYEYLQNNRTNLSAVLMYSLWLALMVGICRGGLTDFPAAMAMVRIGFMILVLAALSVRLPSSVSEQPRATSAG